LRLGTDHVGRLVRSTATHRGDRFGYAIWYSMGLPALPPRWVLIRDPEGEFETQALLCTDFATDPRQILSWFVKRWQKQSTFRGVESA